MRKSIGIVLVLLGIALGVYVGFWVLFVGGIVQVIEAVRAPQLHAGPIALGIARILFAGFFGLLSGMVLILPGVSMARRRARLLHKPKL